MGRGGKRESFLSAIGASRWMPHLGSPARSPSSDARRVVRNDAMQRYPSESNIIGNTTPTKKIKRNSIEKENFGGDDDSVVTSASLVSCPPRVNTGKDGKTEETVTGSLSPNGRNPTYLLDSNGDRTVRVSSETVEDQKAEKKHRRSRVDSSVTSKLSKDSISNNNENHKTDGRSIESSFSFSIIESKLHERTINNEPQQRLHHDDDDDDEDDEGDGNVVSSPKRSESKKKKTRLHRASLAGGSTVPDEEKAKKKKKKEKRELKRHKSVGALLSRKVSREERRIGISDRKDRCNDVTKRKDVFEEDVSAHALMSVPWSSDSRLKTEGSFKIDRHPSSSSLLSLSPPKSPRMTVDKDGKVRRSKRNITEDSEGGEEDGSQISKPSKSGSMRSGVSNKSKKSSTSKGGSRVKEKDRDHEKKKKHKKKKSKKEDHEGRGREAQKGSPTSATSNTSGTEDMDECSSVEHDPNANKELITPTGSGGSVSPTEPTHNCESPTSTSLEKSLTAQSGLMNYIDPIKAAALQEEIDSLHKALLVVKSERTTGLEETAHVKRELRETKVELQSSQTECRQLRTIVQEQEEVIRQQDMKIVTLEKAVESQLDKVDELEEEVRRADEEILALEDRFTRLEESPANDGMDRERQRRLEEQLEKKERELELREQELEEERKKLMGRVPPQNDNDLNELTGMEKDESRSLLVAKEEEIESLKRQLERFEGEGDNANSTSKETSSSSRSLQRNDDPIGLLQQEIQRLKEQLTEHNSGDSPHVSQELEAARADVSALLSKFESAQRRNQVLEDDVDHWKSVNCNLEDELAEWKSQALKWKSRYESASNNGADPISSRIGELPGRPANSAAHISMTRQDEVNSDSSSQKDEVESTHTTISSLWSKFTSPNLNMSSHSGRSREASLNKEVFT